MTNMTKTAKSRALASYDKEATRKALSAMYKNVTMAKHSIKVLTEYVDSQEMRKCLSRQTEKYEQFLNEIEETADNIHHTVRRERKAYLAMAKMGIRMQMIFDDSTEHAAKMMMKGTLMGIIDMNSMVNETPRLEETTANIAKRLTEFEEQRMDELKKYL